MICYRGMTFCSSNCTNAQCGRFFSPEVAEAARKWWGRDNAPVSLADFSKGCAEYIAPNYGSEK